MMLIDKIDNEIKKCMKNYPINNSLVYTYRSIKSKAREIARENKDIITDDIVIKAINKEIKELEQEQEGWSKLNSDRKILKITMIDALIRELRIWLPKQMSEQELREKIKSFFITKPSGLSLGQMMKMAMAEFGTLSDGRTINSIVKEIKNERD